MLLTNIVVTFLNYSKAIHYNVSHFIERNKEKLNNFSFLAIQIQSYMYLI